MANIVPPSMSSFEKIDPREQRSAQLKNLLNSEFSQPKDKQYQNLIDKFFINDAKVTDLLQILLNSKSDIEVFTKWYRTYGDYKDLVAIGIFDEQRAAMLNYFYQKDLQSQLLTTPNDKLNISLIETNNKRFQRYLADHPEVRTIKDTNDSNNLKLPRLYLLGNQNDFNMLQAMSLNTEIFLLDTIESLQKFEADEHTKVVILSQNANPKLAKNYNRIFHEQFFDTLQMYKTDKDTSVVPFNRKNLIDHLLKLS